MNQTARLICPCCGFETGLTSQAYFSCPGNKSKELHILQKEVPPVLLDSKNLPSKYNPFSQFKKHFFSWHLSQKLGFDYDSCLNRIQARLEDQLGIGFKTTPLTREARLAGGIGFSGDLWVKNETSQLTGSHKCRHMMGSLLYLELFHETKKPDLAIYSCGNAALAAAAIAQAGGYPLHVFLPANVLPLVERSISAYGAQTVVCPRQPGVKGDPSYLEFQKALQKGLLPFSCSGPDNWSNIEGGQTLILETLSQLKTNLPSSIFIQVGGGALASSAIQGIYEQYQSGFLKKLPKIHAVQTEACFPLAQAYFSLMKTIASSLNLQVPDFSLTPESILNYSTQSGQEIQYLANMIQNEFYSESVQKTLHDATLSHRYIKTWEHEPHSLAHGILDDFTYDWYTIIRGLFVSGGWPVIVSENDLKEANRMARTHTAIPVDTTGTSGLAGFMQQQKRGNLCESALVFFTGIDRNH